MTVSVESGPVAMISRSALSHNARIAAGDTEGVFGPDLLLADAWGHGAALVRSVLEAEGLRHAPDPLTLFGLPGGAPGSVPVMRLKGVVLSTKHIRAGEGVSYGYTYRADRDTRVALVTGGYAQGIVRALGNRARVLLGGTLQPIVGRVAMDVCVVEIGEAPVTRAQEVVFFGDPSHGEPSLAEWEQITELSAAELVAAVGLHAVREEIE